MKLIIFGQPYVKKSNQRTFHNGHRIVRVDTPRYKEWHVSAIKQLRMERKPEAPIDYPINLKCKFFMRTRGRVDLSALYEGIQDVLVEEGWLSDDNFNIVASHDGSGVVHEPTEPRMEITITPKET